MFKVNAKILLGILCFLIALISFIKPDYLYTSLPIKARMAAIDSYVEHSETASIIPQLPINEYLNIYITYPERMRINQTSTVEVEYHKYVDQFETNTNGELIKIKKERQADSSSRPIKAKLLSPAFVIEPDEEIIKGTEYKLPQIFHWLIKPKEEGNHLLEINLLSLLYFGGGIVIEYSPYDSQQKYIAATKLVLNNQEQKVKESGIITLPVTVTTIWGFSALTLNILRICFSLIGFILVYPLVATKINDYFKNRNHSKRNNRIR